MNMDQSWKELNEELGKARALEEAEILFEWDNETLAPPAAMEYTARTMERLAGMYFRIMTGDRLGELLEKCRDRQGTEEEQAVLRAAEKKRRELILVPAEEYEAYSGLKARASALWARARKAEDFERFAPALEEIIACRKRFAAGRAKEGQPLYDVMLDEFEEGFSSEKLDRFFALLRKELVPLLEQIREKGTEIPCSFLQGGYSGEGQEKLAEYLAKYLGFDFERGVMGVSAHPFTTALHSRDVRFTTHYDSRVDHSLFSVIHECGHGIYEQGISPLLVQTAAGEGASMGMHESQSRFYENMIGRNRAFWEPVYPRLQELFPGCLGNIDMETFYRAVNRVEPGPIRIEADELTYSLHIMVRYELEKGLIAGEISVGDLPGLWEKKYEEYLGIRPQSVSQGVLQDIHWSQGSIGYFPSYALGSAFAAQIYGYMNKEMDMEELMRTGRMDVIREYLREHVHQYGKRKNSREILREMTGQEFEPAYYVEYLKEKFRRLYGI